MNRFLCKIVYIYKFLFLTIIYTKIFIALFILKRVALFSIAKA